ncbi:MAG: competence protein TfoX [Sulfuricurvum sp. PC08-66]|nr:MAG: competence protein TfoX [Sulfuricurvum sp. PC08-66]
MASDSSFIHYVIDQIQGAGNVRYRAMFGGYAIYCDEKVVALADDTQLFVKPTEAGKVFIGEVVEARAYPEAKPSYLIEKGLDDSEWLSTLVRITADALPAPKPKKSKK